MGTFLGVPIIRTIVYLGLYWGPLILGNYHIRDSMKALQDARIAYVNKEMFHRAC